MNFCPRCKHSLCICDAHAPSVYVILALLAIAAVLFAFFHTNH